MRRFLLSILSVCTLGLTPVAAQSWTSSIKPFEGANTQLSTPMAVAADGSSYVCGDFDTEMTVGGNLLSPIANSAYVIKYAANGDVAWALCLSGSVSINSAVTDAEGNLYIAGKVTGEVTLGSINDETRVIYGAREDDDSFSFGPYNAFIAKYSADGNLLAANVLDLKPCEEVKMAEEMEMGFTSMTSGNVSLALDGSNVYAALLWAGEFHVDGQSFASPTYAMFGFYTSESKKAGVFRFASADLSLIELTASIESNDANTEMEYAPESVGVAAANGKVYVSASLRGLNKLTTKAQSIPFNFLNVDGAPHDDGFVAAAINVEDGFVSGSGEYRSAANESVMNYNKVGAMAYDAVNGRLYIAGTCAGEKVFGNETYNVAGASDLFVAQLSDNASMACNGLWLSNYDEVGARNNNTSEFFNGMTFIGNEIFAYGFVYDSTYGASEVIGGMGLTGFKNAPDQSSGYTTEEVITAYGTNGQYSTIVKQAEGETLAISGYNTPTGIEQAANDGCIRFIDNTLTSSAPADMEVYNLNGSLVKATKGATSLQLNDLPNGLYIVKTAQGNLKIVKE